MKIVILLLSLMPISLLAQYPFYEIADHGSDNAVKPYYKDGKVCSFIKNQYPSTHFSLIEIDATTHQYNVTRIDSINMQIGSPSLYSAFEIINFNGTSRRIGYNIDSDSIIQVLTYDPIAGIQHIDTVNIPANLDWVQRAYCVHDSLFLFIGTDQLPNLHYSIVVSNTATNTYTSYLNTLGMYHMDMSQNVSLIQGHMEWYNNLNQWYRIQGDLSIDTAQGMSPSGGTALYNSAYIINNTIYNIGTFMEHSYPANQYRPEHHIQIRSPQGNVTKMWYVPNNTGPITNTGHAHDPARDFHYLSGNEDPLMVTNQHRDIYLSKVSLNNNLDSATIHWDVTVGNEYSYQNLGIVYANDHIYMLNRYYDATVAPATPYYEFRIFSQNGYELSNEEPVVLHIDIYPNPADHELRVESPVDIESVQVFNSLGQMILEREPKSEHATIDIRSLPSGTYTILCTHANGTYKQVILIN